MDYLTKLIKVKLNLQSSQSPSCMRRIQKELSILGYASRLKQPVSDKKRERYYPLQDDFSHWGRITQVAR
mgnify:CR=1 FL=1